LLRIPRESHPFMLGSRVATEESEMKARWNGACAALMLSISALAHAQGAPAAAQADTAAQQAAAVTSNGALTRAQVYEQLVQAERDGQLQMLNKTLYAHH
jgi:hypothetical protein